MRFRGCAMLVSAGLLLAACEGRNGDSGVVFAQFSSQEMGYSLEYLAPPWELKEENGKDLELQIKTELLGKTIAGAPPTHTFRIGPAESDDTVVDLLGSTVGASVEGVIEGLGDGGFADAGFDDEGAFATTGFETSGTGDTGIFDGETGGFENPLDALYHLKDVDVTDARAVAEAELDFVVNQYGAEVISRVAEFSGPEDTLVWMARVQGAINIRVFYIQSSDRVIRASFSSVFGLESYEVDYMVRSIQTASSGEQP